MILAAAGIAPAAPRVGTGPKVGKAFNEELFAAVGCTAPGNARRCPDL
jgi:hypothetical protein